MVIFFLGSPNRQEHGGVKVLLLESHQISGGHSSVMQHSCEGQDINCRRGITDALYTNPTAGGKRTSTGKIFIRIEIAGTGLNNKIYACLVVDAVQIETGCPQD
ncbi:hypothetical protein NPIL_76321 [Nephila pilipes]|uniref:Uncharacterized protein n=1 Tax=Nephila pilipes TaxID=299642 RepID=A0A8X6TQZ8_NEPPI|nr:hypothetical protein NPIL_76321 [Nephila pilipes]